ncbi:uncharacterized protein N7511_006322 [Penicillium nucicola]|uniref:uncharacterized protein n=1 Tax=Penicillium nucicola TaxID=1850975 RepID=UPI002544E543|nr:uncharacterized protein N7511_006322 [Penicillium nucicola]KAJ5757628.1 hypothetical protein N7511_006322 [Penicillium nucicola]
MPSHDVFRSLRLLSRSSSGILSGPMQVTLLTSRSTLQQRCLTRSMATEAKPTTPLETQNATEAPQAERFGGQAPVSVVTYRFPDMKPEHMIHYSRRLLQMPIRHDILHRAVVYEGDGTRQGTASTKWRDDVHGSHRKLYAQKGSGRARAGDKQSPVRRGGGVAHGPHPRDFSTDLPRKVYAQAWRTALSYRHARGELIVVENSITLPDEATPFFVRRFAAAHGWDQKKGRVTLITRKADERLAEAAEKFPKHVKYLELSDVDVKDMLETGRIVIEKRALHQLLRNNSTDLTSADRVWSPSLDGQKILGLGQARF